MVKKINLNLLGLFEFIIPPEKKVAKKAGLPPGTLIYVGKKRQKKTKITVIDYDKDNVEEKEIENVELCAKYSQKNSISWINVDGIEDVGVIEKVVNAFDIHALVAEDILNTGQRPKLEDHNHHLFVCLKMLTVDQKNSKVISEHVSFVIGDNYVLSFQEAEGDIFNVIRNRIREDKGRVRQMRADYLAYTLIDTIVDHYFVVLEVSGEKIEILETEILQEKDSQVAQRIHLLKRDLIFLRKHIWPLRELVSGLARAESKLIRQETQPYLRDLYDHTIQVIDTVDSHRDMISGIYDVYLSTISNRMNEIMKVLTIFAALFIPLTFLAGIYGMNFENMPELKWENGYFGVLGLMGFLGFSMLVYFKRKKWM